MSGIVDWTYSPIFSGKNASSLLKKVKNGSLYCFHLLVCDVEKHEEAPHAADVGAGEEDADVEVGRGEAQSSVRHETGNLAPLVHILRKRTFFTCRC